jgi:hypothetical protein
MRHLRVLRRGPCRQPAGAGALAALPNSYSSLLMWQSAAWCHPFPCLPTVACCCHLVGGFDAPATVGDTEMCICVSEPTFFLSHTRTLTHSVYACCLPLSLSLSLSLSLEAVCAFYPSNTFVGDKVCSSWGAPTLAASGVPTPCACFMHVPLYYQVA